MAGVLSAYTLTVPAGGTVPIANGGTGQASAAAALTALGGLVAQASTPAAGFALQNATPTICSWVAPNDGQTHMALVVSNLHVTVTEVGGALNVGFTLPDGTTTSVQIQAPAQAAGVIARVTQPFFVQPGTTVSYLQGSALTGGTAVTWAQIWGL